MNSVYRLLAREKSLYVTSSYRQVCFPWTLIVPLGVRHRSHSSTATAGTYYDVLDIPGDSTQAQIKAAYYQLSMKWHPDRNKSETAHENFADINEAYRVLGDVKARKRYDRGIGEAASMHRAHTCYGAHTVYGAHAPRSQHYTATPPRHKRRPASAQMSGSLYNNRGQKVFDFDKFFQEHYRASLQYEQKNRHMRKKYQEDFSYVINKRPSGSNASLEIITRIVGFALFFVAISILFGKS